MAREIVITSVPRGVKLGRTGFQVAMQTAGMRDDVTAVLEKMAGYRHLPAGAGANPVCYFHRIARTVAGQLNVVGRIVDAGVDFSNRSNKLAHMLVVEPGELAQTAQSSPAAVLAAVEPRLSTAWTRGPEERQAPFSLAGIPPSPASRCVAWEQALGDAGWAGVLAERAIQNQPTLVIGPDPSPAACRRMLALFQEALALVPPQRRWSVTFDTTTLAAEGILWRGTYAGSPESQVMHPGLLVIDLSRPQPLPAAMTASELVRLARSGPALASPAAVGSAGGGKAVGAAAGGPPDGAQVAGASGPPPPVPGGVRPGPPPGEESGFTKVRPGGRRRRAGGAWIAIGIVTVVFLLLGLTAAVGFLVWQRLAPDRALARIQDYADDPKLQAPTADDLRIALKLRAGDPEAKAAEDQRKFLTSVLATEEITSAEIKDRPALESLLTACRTIQTLGTSKDEKARGALVPHCRLLGVSVEPAAARLLAGLHPGPFADHAEFREWATACNDLVSIASSKPKERADRALDGALWAELVKRARAKDGQEPRDYAKAAEAFVAKVATADVESPAALVAAVQRMAPPRLKKDEAAVAGQGQQPPPTTASKGPAKDPMAAWQALQAEQKKAEAKARSATPERPWPPDAKAGLELLAIDPTLVDGLDVELNVGKRDGFEPQVQREDGSVPRWRITIGDTTLATLGFEQGKLILRRGEVDDATWKKHEADLRTMPIAFKAKAVPWGPGQGFIVASPKEVTLAPAETLHDLVCDADGSVPLPVAGGLGEGVEVGRITLRAGTIDVPGSPLTLAVITDGPNTPRLEISAEIEERKVTLSEPISVDGTTLRRTRASWTDRTARWKLLPEATTLDAEKTKLGFGDKQAIPQPDKNIPNVFFAALSDVRSQPFVMNDVKELLKDWTGSKAVKDIDLKPYTTLSECHRLVRECVVAEGKKFAQAQVEAYQQSNKRPPEPGSPPVKGKNQPENEFNALKAKHQKESAAWTEWWSKCDQAVESAADDPRQLRSFLASQQPPDPAKPVEIDPQVAAIEALLELDGLILAKQKRDEVEDLLRRVPIAALFEGTATREWQISDGGKPTPTSVTVQSPAVRLLPATVNPATVADRPPRQD